MPRDAVCALELNSSVTVTSTCIFSADPGTPVNVLHNGSTLAGCHATATRIDAVADDAVGRIKIDPARARKIDLQPGVLIAADHLGRSRVRHKDVTTNKPGGEAERADRVDHQPGEVAARTAAASHRHAGALHAPFAAMRVGELLLYAKRMVRRSPIVSRRPVRGSIPMAQLDFLARLASLERANQIRLVVDWIAEREGGRAGFQW